jgi:DNA-directed RNA polymerase specialized sigma24 family protein
VVTLSDAALHSLLNADPERGWRAFVDQYTPTLVALIERAGVVDRDDRSEVYVRICERLAEHACARLRQHDPAKGALAAWLTIVVRHAVVDWVRSRAGRRRLFEAIAELDDFDRRVFELYYWERHRVSEIAELAAQPNSRRVSVADVFEALARIERALSERHRAELLAHAARSRPMVALDAPTPPAIADDRANPEDALRVKRLERAIVEALATLDPVDAAIVRLLFVQGWALLEVQRALHLQDLTRERVRGILARLRAALEARGVGADSASAGGLAFLGDETT